MPGKVKAGFDFTFSIVDTLTELQKAGLGSLPGGGAEILRKEIRDRLCPEKISGERWLEIMELVHAAGLKSNATMLYGHLESYADRVDHMGRLRELQVEYTQRELRAEYWITLCYPLHAIHSSCPPHTTYIPSGSCGRNVPSGSCRSYIPTQRELRE